MSNGDAPEKVAIIVMSGDMDRVMGSFIIANGAAAFDMEVTMFFTFWGLKAIQKGNPTGKGFFGKMLGVMNRGGIDRIGPSKFNFGGIGRWMFKKMMKDKNVTPLPTMLQQAQELGVKLIACEMSMNVMEIAKEDLIDGVEIAGVATYIAEASESKISLFI
jgi:peroxiredoxin family protein